MTVEQGLLLIRLGTDIVAGDKKDALAVGRQLVAMATELIPVDQLKEFLTERDRTFADLTVDVAEAIKLEGEKL